MRSLKKKTGHIIRILSHENFTVDYFIQFASITYEVLNELTYPKQKIKNLQIKLFTISLAFVPLVNLLLKPR